MSIAIRQGSADQLPPADSWIDALTKLIPGEVIAAFTGALYVDGVADNRTAQLTLLVALTPLAPLILHYSARRIAAHVHPLQYAVRPATFVLYGLVTSPALKTGLDGLHWILGVGAFVIALLASIVIAPRS